MLFWMPLELCWPPPPVLAWGYNIVSTIVILCALAERLLPVIHSWRVDSLLPYVVTLFCHDEFTNYFLQTYVNIYLSNNSTDLHKLYQHYLPQYLLLGQQASCMHLLLGTESSGHHWGWHEHTSWGESPHAKGISHTTTRSTMEVYGQQGKGQGSPWRISSGKLID